MRSTGNKSERLCTTVCLVAHVRHVHGPHTDSLGSARCLRNIHGKRSIVLLSPWIISTVQPLDVHAFHPLKRATQHTINWKRRNSRMLVIKCWPPEFSECASMGALIPVLRCRRAADASKPPVLENAASPKSPAYPVGGALFPSFAKLEPSKLHKHVKHGAFGMRQLQNMSEALETPHVPVPAWCSLARYFCSCRIGVVLLGPMFPCYFRPLESRLGRMTSNMPTRECFWRHTWSLRPPECLPRSMLMARSARIAAEPVEVNQQGELSIRGFSLGNAGTHQGRSSCLMVSHMHVAQRLAAPWHDVCARPEMCL